MTFECSQRARAVDRFDDAERGEMHVAGQNGHPFPLASA